LEAAKYVQARAILRSKVASTRQIQLVERRLGIAPCQGSRSSAISREGSARIQFRIASTFSSADWKFGTMAPEYPSRFRVRHPLLLGQGGTAKHVVAEVMTDRRWVVVDPTYRAIMKDAGPTKHVRRMANADAITIYFEPAVEGTLLLRLAIILVTDFSRTVGLSTSSPLQNSNL